LSGGDYGHTLNFAKNTTNNWLLLAILLSFLTVVGPGSVAYGDFVVAPRTGAWTAGFDHLGRGLGKLAGKQVIATASGLETIRDHLSKLDPSVANAVMLRRIEDATKAGRPLEGADAVFYTHEIAEQSIMKSRLVSQGGDYLDHYSIAHGKVLEIYGNSPFSVYHPEAILADDFLRTNPNWLKFWGINP